VSVAENLRAQAIVYFERADRLQEEAGEQKQSIRPDEGK
jgi:hypothetical protein